MVDMKLRSELLQSALHTLLDRADLLAQGAEAVNEANGLREAAVKLEVLEARINSRLKALQGRLNSKAFGR